MVSVHINIWAIVLAVVVNMILGYIWYSPVLFAGDWMKMNGLTKKQTEQGRMPAMFVMLVLAVLEAYVLRHLVVYIAPAFPTYSAVSVGFFTGLWAWLGFVLPVMGANYMFAGRRKKLLAIDIGYYLIALPVMGMILARIV